MKLLEKIEQTKNNIRETEEKLGKLQLELQSFKNKARESLSVDCNNPCRVALLPSGEVVVQIYCESKSQPNELYLVDLEKANESGVIINE